MIIRLDVNELDCREVADGIKIKVRVQPRASRCMVTGLVGGSLKLALTSPPVDGAANEACIRFFADLCGIAKSQVVIVNGQKSREKVVYIAGVNKTNFFQYLFTQ